LRCCPTEIFSESILAIAAKAPFGTDQNPIDSSDRIIYRENQSIESLLIRRFLPGVWTMSQTNGMIENEKEGTLTAMLQSIGDHISIMDTDLNIIWANDVAKERFGNDIIGKKCYQAYHNRSTPCEPSPCISKQALADGKIHEHDTEVIDKEGNTICFHCTANVALRDAYGMPTRIIEISRDITALKKAEAEKDQLIEKLRKAFEKIKTLNRLLPICAHCKKIRNDQGYWQQVEEYLHDNADMLFSHSICPACMKKLYPGYGNANKKNEKK
jgi:PAS domain S-box-containing protein